MVITVHTGKTNVTAETLSSTPMTLTLTSQLISIMFTESRRGVYIKHLVDPGRIAARHVVQRLADGLVLWLLQLININKKIIAGA